MCSKVFSVAGQGIKALDTHVKGTKHIQRLPNRSTGKILFTSSSNIMMAIEPENAAKKVEQTLIVPLIENQSTSKMELFGPLMLFYQNILFDPVTIKPSYSVRYFRIARLPKSLHVDKLNVNTLCVVL